MLPRIFNIYSKQIMRKALSEFTGTAAAAGRKITDLRYTDDVVLTTGPMKEL